MQGLLELIWTEEHSSSNPGLLSLGYFSTVIYVKFSFANSTAGANFRPFLCMVTLDVIFAY